MTESAFRSVRAGAVAAALGVVGLAACSDPIGIDPNWQVIEEVTFAPMFGIDLDSMYKTGTGVYWEDRVVGSGSPALWGSTPFVSVQNWLADGTPVAADTFGFFMGNNRVLAGIEDGILNQMAGGTRLIIVPPSRGYAGQDQYDTLGNVLIPAGSVLVFEVTVDSVK